ncbi:hypothetical protein NOW01_03915 [Anoxybacillus salavatliensis]|uniref:hypothetical protein n=1 Tax=Anoxybacillus gonensis TaxID=198467 RepID=UPI00214CDF86|nr:hypothetical protein [Anoxybacillus gonensis]MCQ5364151.1 hypothetical protein [Anoxybacillus gonensis]
MKKEYKQKISELKWVDEIYLEYDLAFGTDIDNALGCNLLEEITSGLWSINYFNDFTSIYRAKKTGNAMIGVDMAFTKNVRTFDNHITKYSKATVNMNKIKGIGLHNYCEKYPFSTVMLIMAYYDVPLPKTQVGKEILLAIDSAHKGFYTPNKRFKQIYINWLEDMGYTSLIDILNQRNLKYFYSIQEQYGLNDKITIDEQGYLHSKIDFQAIQPHFDFKIGLPAKQFHHIKTFKTDAHKIGEKPIPSKDKLISLAYTYKNWVCYTYKNDDEAGAVE